MLLLQAQQLVQDPILHISFPQVATIVGIIGLVVLLMRQISGIKRESADYTDGAIGKLQDTNAADRDNCVVCRTDFKKEFEIVNSRVHDLELSRVEDKKDLAQINQQLDRVFRKQAGLSAEIAEVAKDTAVVKATLLSIEKHMRLQSGTSSD